MVLKMKKSILIVIIGITAMLFCGCASESYNARFWKLQREFTGWEQEQYRGKVKQVCLNMSMVEVFTIKGNPTNMHTTIDVSGTHDFWTYGSDYTYYFLNDVLISFDKR